jgi:hypothetical protein
MAVVVPIRDAHGTVRHTLESLLEQTAEYPAEVIAVIAENDPTRKALEGLAHPHLSLVVGTGKLGVPQLRRIGVERSSAPLVAITEDHCRFPAGWIRGLAEAIKRSGADVCGGPVTNGLHSWAGWAQYFTRYSAFMTPRAEGWTRSLPGNNACYRREVLLQHSRSLEAGFWEAEFNAELLRGGSQLWSCPELAVVQHQHRGAFGYVPLRFRHGRCYGARRVAAAQGSRWRLLARSPFIPVVLLSRILRAAVNLRPFWLRFLIASPLVTAYVLAWSAGEAVGYLLGAGGSCQETD